MSCGVGHRCGWDRALLSVLSLGTSLCHGWGSKKTKKKKKKRKKKEILDFTEIDYRAILYSFL